MRATSVASKLSIRKPSAAVAASPASFQPLKADTTRGLRSCGRSLQTRGSIEVTVPERSRGATGSECAPVARPLSTDAIRAARGDDFEAVAALLEALGRAPVTDVT